MPFFTKYNVYSFISNFMWNFFLTLPTIQRMNKWIFLCLAGISIQTQAQQSNFLQEYRAKVKEYNQDIKAAGYAVSIQKEKEKLARADFLPSLSGNANFNYTGNPAELSVDIPSLNEPVSFQGRNSKYGASLTLAQPIYAGGAIKAGYDKAKKESELSHYEQIRITNNIIYDADVYYWNKVARQEMVTVAEELKESVSTLVKVVKDRVDEEYSDRNDLLMAEVKLNDAEYRLIQSRNDAEVARLSMNSFSGIPFNEFIETDSVVMPLTDVQDYSETLNTAMATRPELQIASHKIDIQKAASKIANAQYLPKLSVGIDGSYSSPAMTSSLIWIPIMPYMPNYLYPYLSGESAGIPKKSGKYSVNIAVENHQKVTDNIRLEIETAFYNYSQAIDKVKLTESSLSKAADNERMAMDKYKEGNISIVEVINAQLYHQDAKVNYIQSKLNAQIAKSGLDRAVGRIDTITQ